MLFKNDATSITLPSNDIHDIFLNSSSTASGYFIRHLASLKVITHIGSSQSTGNGIFLAGESIIASSTYNKTFGSIIMDMFSESASGTASRTEAAADFTTANDLAIGALNSSSQTRYFEGYLMEILVFPSDLSDTNHKKVEGYLAWKWKRESMLPVGHPYKSYPPIL
jgi:hypothetical protein